MLARKLLLAAAVCLLSQAVAAAQFAAPIFQPGVGTTAEPPTAPGSPAATPNAPPAPKPERLWNPPASGLDQEGFLPPSQTDALNDIGDPPICPPVWTSLEYLYWATQGVGVGPLVTTGPTSVAQGTSGLVGQPSTAILFGNERLLNQMRSGFRTEVGIWLDDEGKYSFATRFYFLAPISSNFTGAANGVNVLAVPQRTTVNGNSTQLLTYVAYPNAVAGYVTAGVQTDFIGWDMNLRRGLVTNENFRIDLFGGYRYTHLGDKLFIRTTSVNPGLPLASTPQSSGEDDLRTRNNFHGGQVGFGFSGRNGRFTYEVQTSVAVGVTVGELDYSRTRVFGVGTAAATTADTSLNGVASPAGVAITQYQAALASGVRYFGVVPEGTVKLGYNPTAHTRLTVGYNFLYWTNVRRAQEVYDYGPGLRGGTVDFWAQGVSLGFELRF